jgi:hypothetical protein
MLAGMQGIAFNFGDTPAGVFASEIANDAARGFAIGTTGALASGRKLSEALEDGLSSAAFSVASTQVNNLIGHSVGSIASGNKEPESRDGAFFYDADWGGWIAIGNAITGPSRRLDRPAHIGRFSAPYTYRHHELGHVPQGRALGIFYLPIHALSLSASWILTGGPWGGSWHRLNPFERWLHQNPSFD